MHVRIVCPEHLAFEGEARFLTVPATDGSLGIAPLHASEIFTITSGFVQLCAEEMGSITSTFAVGTGYVQVASDKIIILAERAEDMAQLDVHTLETQLQGFEDELVNLSENDARRSNLYNEIAWCKLLLTELSST
ncbi:F0F1 ATP synthase subunit epsilon [Collinsella sp. zg1085]|nr:F0F1 ATP synthase subunit epsilon [Collinsella sp. zg1085]QWT18235.1 F0F1 ATP synthase subunit epsilon [Collinsella sp. zg1085]